MNMETEIVEPKQAKQEIPEGYKWTEVGVIPEDWEVYTLIKLTNITSGESPSQFQFVLEGFPYYKVDQLNNSSKYLGKSETDYFIYQSGSNVKAGSVLFPKRGASIMLNKIRLLKEDGFMDTNMMALTPVNNEITGEFIFYILSYQHLSAVADVTSIPQINNKHIKSFAVPLPIKKEQISIATALSDVDNLIESLDQLIAKKQVIKKATMQQLLTGQKRLSGFEEEWEVTRLGDVANLYQPETIPSNRFKSYGYPVYGANGFVGYFKEFNHKNSQVIVTCRGSTCGTVNWTPEKSWITGNAMVVNCDSNENINRLFLYYLMIFKDLSDCITGSGQPQIVRKPLSDFKIFIPSNLNEQFFIASILFDADQEIESLQKRRDKTRQIKQGMMQELLTGRTRLNHDWKGLADGHDLTASIQSSNQANPKNQGTDH